MLQRSVSRGHMIVARRIRRNLFKFDHSRPRRLDTCRFRDGDCQEKARMDVDGMEKPLNHDWRKNLAPAVRASARRPIPAFRILSPEARRAWRKIPGHS